MIARRSSGRFSPIRERIFGSREETKMALAAFMAVLATAVVVAVMAMAIIFFWGVLCEETDEFHTNS